MGNDIALDVKKLLEFSVVLLCPNDTAAGGFDEPHIGPYGCSRYLHATCESVPGFAVGYVRVVLAGSVGKRALIGQNNQVGKPGQVRDEVVGKTSTQARGLL